MQFQNRTLGLLSDIWPQLIPEIRGTRAAAHDLEERLSSCHKPVTLFETQASKQSSLSSGETEAPVSIILATFRAEKTILRALKSLEEQTYRNKELVVVDDGTQSLDKTIELITAFMNRHNTALRVKFIPLPINTGFAAATRNAALSQASASIVTFLDDDDLLASNESLATLMRPHLGNKHLLASIGDYLLCDAKGRPSASGHARWKRNEAPPTSWRLLFALNTMLSSIAIKKELAKLPYIRRHEDMGPYFEAINEAARIQYEERGPALEETIALVPEAIYKYCQREGSLFTKSDVSSVQKFQESHAALTYAFTLPYIGLIPGSMEFIKTRYSKHLNLRRRARTSSPEDWAAMLELIHTPWLNEPIDMLQKKPPQTRWKPGAKATIPPRLISAIQRLFRSHPKT